MPLFHSFSLWSLGHLSLSFSIFFSLSGPFRWHPIKRIRQYVLQYFKCVCCLLCSIKSEQKDGKLIYRNIPQSNSIKMINHRHLFPYASNPGMSSLQTSPNANANNHHHHLHNHYEMDNRRSLISSSKANKQDRDSSRSMIAITRSLPNYSVNSINQTRIDWIRGKNLPTKSINFELNQSESNENDGVTRTNESIDCNRLLTERTKQTASWSNQNRKQPSDEPNRQHGERRISLGHLPSSKSNKPIGSDRNVSDLVAYGSDDEEKLNADHTTRMDKDRLIFLAQKYDGIESERMKEKKKINKSFKFNQYRF